MKYQIPRLNPAERNLIRLMFDNGFRLRESGSDWKLATDTPTVVSEALCQSVVGKALIMEPDKGSGYILTDMGRLVGKKASETYWSSK